MGAYLKDHDIYVGTLQDQLNLRFAPSMAAKQHLGGLDEMVALQKEFQIFKPGRSFDTSVASLGLGGGLNSETRKRFHLYLRSLRKKKSNVPNENGDVAIVNALIANLAAKKPLPVHFQPHSAQESKAHAGVIITPKARPLFYVKRDYLVISLPLDSDQ